MKEHHCSKRHNFCSCEKLEGLKKIQACTGFGSLTFAIPVQRSTNIELKSQPETGR